MTITILIGDKQNVDFREPLEVTEEKEQVLQLFKRLFSVVEVMNTSEFRNWRMGDNDRIQYPRAWTAEEYEVLLKSHSIEDASDKLGRSGMAVIVQDGFWRPAFFNWCHEKGKNPYEGELVKVIKEFMKEKEDELLKKRNRKKELKQKEIEIEILNQELEYLQSEKKRDLIELGIRIGQLKCSNAEEYLLVKRAEINSKMKKLKEEIEKMVGV